MIAITMAYYNRPYQLKKTLLSIKGDVYVIIADDNSDQKPEIPELSYPAEVIDVKKGDWINGVPAYNMALKKAVDVGAEVIIIQNPECYHVGNITEYAAKVKADEYIVFGCFSINQEITFSEHNIHEVISNIGASYDGQTAWYNHSVYRPVNYHFCAAIRTENIIKLNGFDERLAYGIGYEDNMLLHQIRNLGLAIRTVDDPFVVHQWHYNGIQRSDKAELIQKNKDIYNELLKEKAYKAQHLITSDL